MQEKCIYCPYSYGPRDHLCYAACPQWYPTSPSPDPPTHLGDLLKLAVTVFLLVCLNIPWLKTIARRGKADGTCLDSVSGMQKLAGTFTSHIGRAKGTYQNRDLHRTHRHLSPKLWSCSAAQILLNSISIFQFKVFQICRVTPQFMHSPAQVLADGSKTVSVLLQHRWGIIKHGWTLAYVSCVSSETFQMQRLRLFTML